MFDSKSVNRYHTGTRKMRYHNLDRARVRVMLYNEAYETLPLRESMRAVINRGPNAWGDDTSYGHFSSGRMKSSLVKKFFESFVSKRFDELTHWVATRFNTIDRAYLNTCILDVFHDHICLGYFIARKYDVRDGVIVRVDK